MRVLMISANTERLNMTILPLGAAMVATAVRARGHDVELLDLMSLPDPEAAIADAVRRHRPQVIGVSVRNVDDQNLTAPVFLLPKAREVVRTCRAASDAPVVVGGAGYSIFPLPALRFLEADYGIVGEGEAVLPDFLDRLATGDDPATLPGVCTPATLAVRRPREPVPLDDLPSPYTELLNHLPRELAELPVPVQTRRGCPFRCSYCSTPAIEGQRVRRRSPSRVVEDLGPLADHGVRVLHFVDNLFNLPDSYALELCRGLVEMGRPFSWRAIVSPGAVRPELAQEMAAAGCTEVALGFESGSDRMLRTMAKGFTAADIRSASEAFQRAGIRRTGFLLLGAPGETRDTVRESFDLVDSLDLEMLKVTVGLRLYPDTPLADTARREGVIPATDDLLRPRFYLAPGVIGWVEDAVASRAFTAKAVC